MGQLRQITPADRLYSELYQIRRDLDRLLAEYEASVSDDNPHPPAESPSFKDQFRREKFRRDNG